MDFGSLINPITCIGWLIVGAIAGSLARQLMRSPDASLVSDIILGIIGAVVGGFVGGLLGFDGRELASGGLGLVLVNLVISIIGAIIVLFLYRLITRRRA